MTYYKELDKGQVYDDCVILGLEMHTKTFLSNILTQEEIFSYMYTEEEKYLEKFINNLYTLDPQAPYEFTIVYTTKDLRSNDVYRLKITNYSNFIVENKEGYISEDIINKYILKLKLSGKIYDYDIYSKKELRKIIKEYISSHKEEMTMLLRNFKYKFVSEFGIKSKYAKKLGVCTCIKINKIYKNIILIKKDNKYGFIDSSKLLISLNLLQMNVDVNTNGVITKAPYYLEISMNNGFLLPNEFRLIKDMRDVNEVFDNFVRAFMY